MKGISDRVLTVPNALTLVRLLVIPVVIPLLLVKEDVLAAALLVLAAVTDFLDGRIARRWGGAGPSRLGMVLDPVADRLLLSSVAAVLAVRGLLPAFVVAMLVGRDALALAGSLVFRDKIRVNKVGKAATAVLMASVVVIIYRPGVMGEIMFYSGLGLSLVAGALYVGEVKKLFGKKAGRERR
ncbi:MAG: CDP-alcohol phosphatidyltransferase family protein [Actinomycetota bacterium]|nr:CDP-alcohol phosphatidyltransferase family protein [Actinomycetota bacterium]